MNLIVGKEDKGRGKRRRVIFENEVTFLFLTYWPVNVLHGPAEVNWGCF